MTGDVTVTGGTKGLFTGTGDTYTLGVTPVGGQNVVVTVETNSATDGLNTGPPNATTATAVWDADVPTVAITGVPSVINSTDAFTATFAFSRSVTGFVTGDVTVTGGMKSAFTANSGLEYALDVTPSGSVDVVVTVEANSATDGVGNVGPPSAVLATATWDSDGPTVAITGVPSTINSTDLFTATFTFSEDVTGFATEDVTVAEGEKGTFTANSGLEYTLDVTPTGGQNVVVTVEENSVTDGVGNVGPPSAVSETATWDSDSPTVTITGVPSTINSTDLFTATFTFSEDVTGFVAEDVTVTEGEKGAFTANSGLEYTLDVTPSGGQNVVVTVEAHSTTDGLNTGPSAAVSATATWDAERVSVENEELSPKLTLHGNYPNPLSDCANIVFDLPQPSQISVYVTDLLGRTVQMIIYGWYETGRNHTAEICMNDAAPGIYHYLLMADTGDQVVQQSKAMAVVR